MAEGNIERLKMQKRARFHMVLEWERKQSVDSEKYKVILGNLIKRLMQKMTNSREANRAVIKFLHEKAQGYRVYSEILISELTYLPDPPADPRSLNAEPITPITPTHDDFNEPEKLSRPPSLRQGLASVSEHQTSLSKSLTSASSKIQ